MMIACIVFMMLLRDIFSYPNSGRYLAGSETGTILLSSVVSQQISSGFYLQMSFEVVFKVPFSNVPDIVLALGSLKNCPSSNQHYVINFHSLATVSTTRFGYKNQIFINYPIDPNLDVVNNYLAINTITNANVQIQHRGFNQNVKNQTTLIVFSKPGVNNPGSIAACFLRGVYCHKPTTLPFTIKISCTVAGTNSVSFNLDSNSEFADLCIGLYLSYMTAIVIRPDVDMIAQSGVLVITPQAFSKINLNVGAALSSYLIGFQGFQLPTYCINFALTTDMIQIDSSSTFDEISFTYFLLQEHRMILILSLPFEAKVTFLYSLNYSLSSVTFNSTFTLVSNNSGEVIAKYNSEIPEEETSVVIIGNIIRQPIITTVFKVIKLVTLTFKIYSRVIDLEIRNTHQQAALNHFSIQNNPNVYLRQCTTQGGTSYLRLSYDQHAIGDTIMAFYNNSARDISASVKFAVTNIMKIETFPLEISSISKVEIKHIPRSTSVTHFKLNWVSNNIDLFECQPLSSSSTISCSVVYQPGTQHSDFVIQYIPYSSTGFSMNIVYKILVVKEIQTWFNSSRIDLVFVNVFEEETPVDKNHFSTNQSFVVEKVEARGDDVVMKGTWDDYLDMNETDLEVKYFLEDESVFSSTTHVKVMKVVSVSFSQYEQYINITLLNTHNFTSSATPTINMDEFQTYNITVTPTQILISFKFQQQVLKNALQLIHTQPNPKIYKQVLNINLQPSFPLYYCQFYTGSSNLSPLTLSIISYILDGLFLLTFLWAIISCQKMYGVELMYLIQLVYYSLIPLDSYCSPFKQLRLLRYSTGALPSLFDFTQILTPMRYRALNIESNFLSNVNLSLLPFFISPLFYLPIKLIGMRTKDSKVRPRCNKYSKSFLLQIPLTILLFNSFNIYTSAAIHIELLGTQDVPSLAVLLVASSLLLIFVVLYLVFSQHFLEFRKEFDQYDDSWCFKKETAVRLRRMYPLILISEFALVPVVIGIKAISDKSLYIVLGIQILITLFVCIIPLYLLRHANIRNIIHRVIVLIILTTLIVFSSLKTQSFPSDHIYHMTPYLLLIILVIGFSCTGTYIIFKSIQFWKQPSSIDIKLLQQNMKKPYPKPVQNNPPPRKSGVWIPRHWYVQKSLQKQKLQLIDTPANKQLTPSEKMFQWFQEMRDGRIQDKLGIDRDFFEEFLKKSPSWFEKQKFIRNTFNRIDVDKILLRQNVVTISDCLSYVGENKCKEIREGNARMYQELFQGKV